MAERKSYTAMSGEGINALIARNSYEYYNTGRGPFEWGMNATDFAMLVDVLHAHAEGLPATEDTKEWAEETLSSFAESLGVDWV